MSSLRSPKYLAKGQINLDTKKMNLGKKFIFYILNNDHGNEFKCSRYLRKY